MYRLCSVSVCTELSMFHIHIWYFGTEILMVFPPHTIDAFMRCTHNACNCIEQLFFHFNIEHAHINTMSDEFYYSLDSINSLFYWCDVRSPHVRWLTFFPCYKYYVPILLYYFLKRTICFADVVFFFAIKIESCHWMNYRIGIVVEKWSINKMYFQVRVM